MSVLHIITNSAATVCLDEHKVSVYEWNGQLDMKDTKLDVFLDNQLWSIPFCEQLKQTLCFPQNQPDPKYCCFDFVHSLKGVYAPRDSPESYTPERLNLPLDTDPNLCYGYHEITKTELPLAGDTFFLVNKNTRQPIHGYAYLGRDVFVWKANAPGGVYFSTWDQMVLIYTLIGNLSASDILVWKLVWHD